MVIEGHPVEILAIERARRTDQGDEQPPVCLFTFRPDKVMDSWVLMLTPEQCVRLRDTLNEFLNDKESWLYVSKARQRKLKGDLHACD
jgi:hypothetical protein